MRWRCTTPRLDTALQASLDDLRVANEELHASRARIVAAADRRRRQIERNLHDGAQQHLVALAVKLGLARQLSTPIRRRVAPMLEELRGDAQETLTELRELAHGIYPPLLMDRGLARSAARGREPLGACRPTSTPTSAAIPPDVEAAVYFCCLEAMQNAGKHAGEGARLTITVVEQADELVFEVADNGAGFDASHATVKGHGFVNMADRVGAIGGSLAVESAAGEGTKVRGRLPLDGWRRRGLTQRDQLCAAVPELAHERRTEVLFVDVRDRTDFACVGREVGLRVRRHAG